jgi:DNA-binding FrmR family transcriptional regulator
MSMSKHESHPNIIKRLKRAEGHLRSIIKMIEDERPCVDVAQQMHAVEKAITNAKEALVRDHIEHCLEHAVYAGGKKSKDSIAEFKEITKYL